MANDSSKTSESAMETSNPKRKRTTRSRQTPYLITPLPLHQQKIVIIETMINQQGSKI